MAGGQDLLWYGTTGQPGTADGQSQANPALWLGDFRASQTLHSLQSTLTASQTAQSRHYVVDSAQIGAGVQAHRMKWLVMVTGGAALAAARVAAFDTASGLFKLDRALPAAASAGDFYRLFSKGNVWPDVSAAQAAAGETRYRCIVFRNQHGGTINAVRLYFRDLGAGAGGADFHRTHQGGSGGGGSSPFLNRATDQLDIFDSMGRHDPQGGPNNFGDVFGNAGGWQNPFGYATADTTMVTLGNTGIIAVWLRRRIPAGAGFRRSVAVQLIAETTTTGSNPSPLVSSALMVYDVGADATAPVGVVTPDRYTHVLGGARLRGRVTRGASVVGAQPVRWTLRPGDAGTLHTDDEPLAGWATTDVRGEAFATYHAPSSAAFAGEHATARMLIGAGEEVGDPQPRLSLEADTTDGDTVAADVTLPSSTQSWDEDLAAGLWPGIA